MSNDKSHLSQTLCTVRAFLDEPAENLPSATLGWGLPAITDIDAWAILRHFDKYGETGIGQVRIRLVSDNPRFRNGVYLNLE